MLETFHVEPVSLHAGLLDNMLSSIVPFALLVYMIYNSLGLFYWVIFMHHLFVIDLSLQISIWRVLVSLLFDYIVCALWH